MTDPRGTGEARSDEGDVERDWENALRHLSVVRLEPGDTLVFRTQHSITPTMAKNMREFMAPVFPGQKCIVLDNGMELSVLRPHYAQVGGVCPVCHCVTEPAPPSLESEEF